MKILMIDLNSEGMEEYPLENPLAGGRLINAQLANQWIDPTADPLGPENALILSCGPLAGKNVSTSGRFSIGGKNPLTGGIKESNAGGMAGDCLAALGYRSLVLRDQRLQGRLDFLVLDENGVRFHDASVYKGLGNEALAEAVRKEFGPGYVVIGIGPAGEAMMTAAGIAISDNEGNPFRIAARGGIGAAMGSKGIKAVLLRKIASAENKNEDKTSRKSRVAFHKHVASNDRTALLREYGTVSTVMSVQILAGLPPCNFSVGEFEGAEEIGGDHMHDLILERGGDGRATHACMRGCVIQCSNVFPDEEGKLAAAPLEFETLSLCGSNIGLDSLDEIAAINRVCNDFGLDTIEVGAALGVMMEAAEKEDLLQDLGIQVIKEELTFNHAAGLSAKDDRLPAYFTNEKLPPKNDVFDIKEEELDRIWADLLQ